MGAGRNTPDLSYTGEAKRGAFFASLGASPVTVENILGVARDAVPLGDPPPDPIYEARSFFHASNQAARFRLDLIVSRCLAGDVVGTVLLKDSEDRELAELLTFDGARGFTNKIFSIDPSVLPNPSVQNNENPDYWIAVKLSAASAGEWEGMIRVVPFGMWGWENFTLANQASMTAAGGGDLFNTALHPGADYNGAILAAKAEVRNRIIAAEIDPDSIWCDGCLAEVEGYSPSGIGTMVVPALILPTTYLALAIAYGNETGYKDGRLADAEVKWRQLYEQSLVGALRFLLAVNANGNHIMERSEQRPHRPRFLER